MKRPLCLLAILLTAAVFIFLEFYPAYITESVPDTPDGSSVTVTGKVQGKEFRKSFDGDLLPVIYLLPRDQDSEKYSLIQCYLDSSDFLPGIGETVMVTGRAKIFPSPTNPGEFDSRLYYSTLKISYSITACNVLMSGGEVDLFSETLFKVRMFFERALDNALEPSDAAIMKAMLLGDKAYMDAEIKDMYKNSGIVHILAVSGLHISIIGMGLYELLRRLALRMAEVFSRIHCICPEALLNRGGVRHLVMSGKSSCFEGALKCEWVNGAAVCNFIPALLAIAFMYAYGGMCGMGTSSFRAICMFTIRLLAPLLGRTYDVLSALALAEILLLLDQPLYVYNSGFLFSFGAVLGIAAVKPVFLPSRKLFGDKKEEMKFVDEKEGALAGVRRALCESIMTSLSVLLVTLPIYACFYYTYPIHSLILNLIVIPVMGILMVLGLAAMGISSVGLLFAPGVYTVVQFASGGFNSIFGAVFALLSRVPGMAVHMILEFYKWLCSGTALRSGFTWYMGHSDKWQVLAYVGGMIIFVMSSWFLEGEYCQELLAAFLKRKHMGAKDRIRALVFADIVRACLLVTAIFLLTFRITPDLEINMIDVGQGDGMLVSCEGRHMLIDGGSTSKKNVGKYQIIPVLKYKGIGRLDAVVLTHEDEDHISGIFEIMDDMEKGGIRIKQLILPEVAESSRGDNYHKLEQRAHELGIPVAYINMGESFSLGKSCFTCLNPELNMVSDGANAYSTVLFMEYGSFTALFTGDVEGEGQEYLKSVIKSNPEKYKNLSLLKVAHHGSQYTTDKEFLSLTNPRVALISCGKDNSYGHPHQELLERLETEDVSVYRTDQEGCISVIKDKESVRVVTGDGGE